MLPWLVRGSLWTRPVGVVDEAAGVMEDGSMAARELAREEAVVMVVVE